MRNTERKNGGTETDTTRGGDISTCAIASSSNNNASKYLSALVLSLKSSLQTYKQSSVELTQALSGS